MKKIFALTVLSTLFWAGSALSTPISWENPDTSVTHWYEVVSAPFTTWTEARALADARSGYLATITSEAENVFIFNELNIGATPMWLGGFQVPGSAEPDVEWQWVTKEDWVYTNWASGEPNNSSVYADGEDSLAFAFFRADGSWNDAPTEYASYKTGGYVVEYDTAPVPEPATMLLFGAGIVGLVTARLRKKKK